MVPALLVGDDITLVRLISPSGPLPLQRLVFVLLSVCKVFFFVCRRPNFHYKGNK
jgi:hypothetical protein